MHYGAFRVLWDWFLIICMFYIAIMVPFNASFVDPHVDSSHGATNMQYVDVVVEIFFIFGKYPTPPDLIP